jgi:predicted metal-dependent peptidase
VLRAYPHLRAELYYADAAIYGPYPLDADRPLPPPRGGGGTRFEPFFEHVEAESGPESLLLYITDGFGSFPARVPSSPVLWVVPPGGAADEAFPFGTVVRLVDDGRS